jgi:hypothetical protein
VGIAGNAPRIRYPVILDARKLLPGDMHSPGFDDSDWTQVMEVKEGPWPAHPEDVETPGQREYKVGPESVLAAGTLESSSPLSEDPYSIAAGIRDAQYVPQSDLAQSVEGLITNQGMVIEGEAGTSRYITLDFHRPVHGYPYLEWEAATPGTVVDWGYCEIARTLYEGKEHVSLTGKISPEGVVGKGYADRMILSQGPVSVELPDERTARWLTLHIHFPQSGSVILRGVGIVKSQYPINPIGTFECGNPRIDQIVRLCLDHAEITMSDSYIDTPGREDGQWIEDARPRALLASRWFGDIQLRRLLIRTFSQSQGEDGNFHPFPPSNYPAYPAPYDWSVQWVACLYDDYLWTGDTEFLARYWETLERYWEGALAHLGEDGVWYTSQVLADIRVGVHPEGNRASSGMITPWMIERLRWSAEMAAAIGKVEAAQQWNATAEKMAEAFQRVHLVSSAEGIPTHVADRYAPEDPGADRGFSQAGQTVAVMSGLLAKEEALPLVDYVFPAPQGSPPEGVIRWNNPTYGYRALKTLSTVGRTERAVAHLLERYGPYLPAHPKNTLPLVLQGPFGGPLPEYWVNREDLGLPEGEINTAQPNDETGSHGWGAVPLLWLHDTLLGVDILEPGGGRIRFAPQDGGLPFVAGYTGTPKGTVWVRWDPQTFELEFSLPEKVVAEVVLPKQFSGLQAVMSGPSGTSRWESGQRIEAGEPGVHRVRPVLP